MAKNISYYINGREINVNDDSVWIGEASFTFAEAMEMISFIKKNMPRGKIKKHE